MKVIGKKQVLMAWYDVDEIAVFPSVIHCCELWPLSPTARGESTTGFATLRCTSLGGRAAGWAGGRAGGRQPYLRCDDPATFVGDSATVVAMMLFQFLASSRARDERRGSDRVRLGTPQERATRPTSEPANQRTE